MNLQKIFYKIKKYIEKNLLLFILITIILLLFILYVSYQSKKISIEKYNNDNNDNNDPKIAFITSIYGDYEKSCKAYKKQSVPTDFICFTNNDHLINNGWIIDKTPYHIINKSSIDNDLYINSLKNNIHNFNIAKYYKQSFHHIPILQKYDVIVWIDGSIEITNENTSKWILDNIEKYKIIGWEHEHRNGILKNEVDASSSDTRYASTHWNGQDQPYQDVLKQYDEYIKDQYDENYFKERSNKENMGVWITCFVAFLHKDPDVIHFLDNWYLQTLKYTTQDQISFSYVAQKNFIPYTLPDNEINGAGHTKTDFFIKHQHGK